MARRRRRTAAQAAVGLPGRWLHAARGTGTLQRARPATANPCPPVCQRTARCPPVCQRTARLSAGRRATAPTAVGCRGRPGATSAAAAGGPGGGRAARAQPAGRPRGRGLGGRAVLSASCRGSARVPCKCTGCSEGPALIATRQARMIDQSIREFEVQGWPGFDRSAPADMGHGALGRLRSGGIVGVARAGL